MRVAPSVLKKKPLQLVRAVTELVAIAEEGEIVHTLVLAAKIQTRFVQARIATVARVIVQAICLASVLLTALPTRFMLVGRLHPLARRGLLGMGTMATMVIMVIRVILPALQRQHPPLVSMVRSTTT